MSVPMVVAAWVTAWLFPVIPVPIAVAPWVPAVVMVVVNAEVSTVSAPVLIGAAARLSVKPVENA